MYSNDEVNYLLEKNQKCQEFAEGLINDNEKLVNENRDLMKIIKRANFMIEELKDEIKYLKMDLEGQKQLTELFRRYALPGDYNEKGERIA